jgi:hypothetical protein
VPLAICSLFVGQVSIPREDFLAGVITLSTLWSHLRNDGRRCQHLAHFPGKTIPGCIAIVMTS